MVLQRNDTGSLRPVEIVNATTPKRNGSDGGSKFAGPPMSAPDILDVIGFDALWESMERCKCGVMWKRSVAQFVLNAPYEIARLSDELINGRYKPGKPSRFVVTCPKRREILGIPFRDRVVQRSYNDNLLYPLMSRTWIYDNYACQTHKGTDFARGRMRCHLERHFRKHGLAGAILCLDVRGYYNHMLWSVMEQNLARKVPQWGVEHAMGVIRSQGRDGRGVTAGSQTSQVVGVDYLDRMDHFIKERLHVSGYGRYMDDAILIHEDPSFLEEALQQIAFLLSGIGLELHPVKTKIIPIWQPFTFLGFKFRLTDSGKVTMALNRDSVGAMKRRVSGLARLESRGLRQQGTAFAAYEGWRAHAQKGCSRSLVERCDAWFQGLEAECSKRKLS